MKHGILLERMGFVLEELVDLQRQVEEELPQSCAKRMDTITGKFENLINAVREIERGKEGRDC